MGAGPSERRALRGVRGWDAGSGAGVGSKKGSGRAEPSSRGYACRDALLAVTKRRFWGLEGNRGGSGAGGAAAPAPPLTALTSMGRKGTWDDIRRGWSVRCHLETF